MPKQEDPTKQLAEIAENVGNRPGNIRLPADVFVHLVNHASDPPEAMATAAKAAEAGKQPVVITCDDFRALAKSGPGNTGGNIGGVTSDGGGTGKASGTQTNTAANKANKK